MSTQRLRKVWFINYIQKKSTYDGWYYYNDNTDLNNLVKSTYNQIGIIFNSIIITAFSNVYYTLTALITNLVLLEDITSKNIHKDNDNSLTESIERLKVRLNEIEEELKNSRNKRLDVEEQLWRKLDGLKTFNKVQWFNIIGLNRRCCLRSNYNAHATVAQLKNWAEQNFQPKLNNAFTDFKNKLDYLSSEIDQLKNLTHTDQTEWVTQETVRSIIRSALALYDADKTGKADYALESAGGKVLSIRDTKTHKPKFTNAAWSFLKKDVSQDPSTVIRPAVSAGQCWAFEGSVGFLVIRLSHAVFISGCTIEHLPGRLHPEGFTSSAPRHFSLMGLDYENDPSPHYFGNFMYDVSGDPVQFFPVQSKATRKFSIVEVVVTSNYGHPEYTCLYRVRVHGSLVLS